MTNQDQSNQQGPKARPWDLGAAVLAALAASICCAGPLAMATLGVGAASAGRLNLLEPYRPVFIALSLGFLGLALYRNFRRRRAECCPQSTSESPHRGGSSRATLWAISAAIVMLLAMPHLATRLPGGQSTCHGTSCEPTLASSGSCCAVADPSDAPANQSRPEPAAPIDPSRELVFEVENLQCPAVKGVGCGSMLWPVLTRIDRLDGVSQSFSNWTGTRLRISLAPGPEAKVVAERVRDFLASDGRQPVAVNGSELTQTLRGEQWHNAAGLIELSSYEFRTVAKRRVGAFANSQKLDAAKRRKLLDLANQLWDKAGEGVEPPSPEPDAYGRYWHSRRDRFVSAFSAAARDVLSPAQVQQLLQQYREQSGTRPADASAGVR
jgi:mercuric ion transport protein